MKVYLLLFIIIILLVIIIGRAKSGAAEEFRTIDSALIKKYNDMFYKTDPENKEPDDLDKFVSKYRELIKFTPAKPHFSLELTENSEPIRKLEFFEYWGINNDALRVNLMIQYLLSECPDAKKIVIIKSIANSKLMELCKMLPDKQFILFTAAAYDEAAKNVKNLEIYHKLPSLKELKQYKGCVLWLELYLFCNEGISPTDWRNTVLKDVEVHKKIIKAIRPAIFATIFSRAIAGTIKHFQGKIITAPWSKPRMNILFLVSFLDSIDKEEKEYDIIKLFARYFYFTTYIRPIIHKHDCSGEGIDYCWDCWASIHIIKKFNKAFFKKKDEKKFEGVSILPHGMDKDETNYLKKFIKHSNYTSYRTDQAQAAFEYYITLSPVFNFNCEETLKNLDI
jgi:hypothetical protein